MADRLVVSVYVILGLLAVVESLADTMGRLGANYVFSYVLSFLLVGFCIGMPTYRVVWKEVPND